MNDYVVGAGQDIGQDGEILKMVRAVVSVARVVVRATVAAEEEVRVT